MARQIATVTGRISNVFPVKEFQNDRGSSFVVNLTVIDSPSFFNRETKKYEEGEPTFYHCVAFGNAANRLANSLKKGDPVHFSTTKQGKQGFTSSKGNEIPVSWEYLIHSGGLDLTLVEADSRRDGNPTDAQVGESSNKSNGGTRSSASEASKPKSSRPVETSETVDDEDLPF